MSDYTPFDKLSKKQQKEANKRLRRTWGSLSPVTRKSPNPKAYNRSKEKSAGVQQDDEAE